MRKESGTASCFRTLRRDSLLFAAVGFLALLLGALHPLLAAASMPATDGSVICTTYGIGKAGGDRREHSPDVECPLCLSGHACGLQLPAAIATATAPLKGPAVAVAGTGGWGRRDRRAARGDDPPPSIRAPPVAAA